MKNLIIGIIVVALIAGAGWYGYTNYMDKGTGENTDAAAQEAQPIIASDATPAGEPVEVAPGLTVQDFVIGEGREAAATMYAAMLYEGRLADGTVFDASNLHGNQPFVFQLGAGQVIQGWDLGVAGMKVGGTRRLTIAPELAYGDSAVGTIPPGSTLTFDVALLATEDAAVVEEQLQAAEAGQQSDSTGGSDATAQ